MKKKILYFQILSTLILSNPCTGQEKEKYFTWPEGKKAAVILTYDDGLDCHLDIVVPALDRYNLKGTFFCTGNSVSLQNRLQEWREIAQNNHELGNHSLFHPCRGENLDWILPEYDLSNYTMHQIRNELYTANTLLKAIDGKSLRSYAYTCSHYEVAGYQSFRDSIADLFIAARGGSENNSYDMNTLDPFFVHSIMVDNHKSEELIAYVQTALEKGSIAVFMFHNVGGGYLNTPEDAHQELLDFLNENRDIIWTDTFLNVMTWVIQEQKRLNNP